MFRRFSLLFSAVIFFAVGAGLNDAECVRW